MSPLCLRAIPGVQWPSPHPSFGVALFVCVLRVELWERLRNGKRFAMEYTFCFN
jgi:hypothetical protein